MGSQVPVLNDAPPSIKPGEGQNLEQLSLWSISDLERSQRVPFKAGVRRGLRVFGRIRQQEKNEKSFVFLFQFIRVCWGEQEPHFFLPMTSLSF